MAANQQAALLFGFLAVALVVVLFYLRGIRLGDSVKATVTDVQSGRIPGQFRKTHYVLVQGSYAEQAFEKRLEVRKSSAMNLQPNDEVEVGCRLVLGKVRVRAVDNWVPEAQLVFFVVLSVLFAFGALVS